MQLKEVYEAFIFDKTAENCTDATIQNYKNMISYFVDFIGDETDVKEIQDSVKVKQYLLYLKKRNVSGKTVHTYLKHIKVFYRWLVNNDYLEYNSVSDLKVNFEKKIPQVLNMNEIHSLLEIENIRDRLLVVLALDCGLRKKELENLNVADIQTDIIFVRNGKGRKDRIVPISPSAYNLVQEYISSRSENTEYLFQKYYSSEKLGYAGVREVFRRLKVVTGIKRLAPHLCRHTYGTYYIHSGGDIKILQMLLGHSEVDTTEMYVHLSNMLDIAKYSRHSIVNIISSGKDG